MAFQIILLNFLDCYFYSLFPTFYLPLMALAPILKSITMVGFLIHYYLLIAFVFVKNLLHKILKHPRTLLDSFSFCPIKAVHPHVFAHPRTYFDQTQMTQFDTMNSHFKFMNRKHQTMLTLPSGELDIFNRQNGTKKTRFQSSMAYLTAQCHGFCIKNSTLMYNFRKKSFPFVLAEQGYDVWVGNNRGTVYSDANSHMPQYWEFNVDHFAQFDQPALINKVLQETQRSKLIYVGHSQGSTQFLLGMSYHEDLVQKIQKFIAMGPVISLQNLKDHGLLKILSKYYLVEILETLGFKTILNLPKQMNRMVGVLIHHYSFYANIILNFIYLLCGKTERNNLDVKRIGVLVSHEPGGTSIQSVMHWVQTYRNGKFRKYDYGASKNKLIYGAEIPPEYTFDHIKQFPFKSYIFRGEKDAVISDKDFDFLIGHFDRNNLQIHTIKDYAHLDYAWSIHAKEDIYDKIVEILKNDKLAAQKQNSENFETEDASFESQGQNLDF